MKALYAVIISLLFPFAAFAADTTPDSYIACGCGCCLLDREPMQETCVKDNAALQQVIKQDKERAKSSDCPVAGCTYGTKYKICVPQEPQVPHETPMTRTIIKNW